MRAFPSLTSGRHLIGAGLEVVIIIVGILLALAADAWWDDRLRAEKELDLLVSLRAEFEANVAELEYTAESHRKYLNAALTVLEEGNVVVSVDETDWDPVSLLVQNSRTDLNSGVLHGYLTLADPSLISDPELRAALESWPATLDQVWQQEARTTRLIDENILPFFASRGDLASTFRLVGAFKDIEQERVQRLRATAVSSDGNAAMLEDPEFRNLAAWRVRAQRDILLKHGWATREHQRIIALLDAAIERRR